MNQRKLIASFAITLMVLGVAYGQDWKKSVPQNAQVHSNPLAGDAAAIRVGDELFHEHCSKCHGDDALGRQNRPNLHGAEVQRASDGELFWLLSHGSMARGMPSWSRLPEKQRWQLVTYLKSLSAGAAEEPAAQQRPNK